MGATLQPQCAGLSLRWSRGSRVHGFRSRCSQALEHTLWFMGWVAPWHVGSSWTRDCTRVSCTGRQTSSPLSHQGSLRILFLSGGDRHVLCNDHTVCRFCSGGDGYKALCEQGKQGGGRWRQTAGAGKSFVVMQQLSWPSLGHLHHGSAIVQVKDTAEISGSRNESGEWIQDHFEIVLMQIVDVFGQHV